VGRIPKASTSCAWTGAPGSCCSRRCEGGANPSFLSKSTRMGGCSTPGTARSGRRVSALRDRTSERRTHTTERAAVGRWCAPVTSAWSEAAEPCSSPTTRAQRRAAADRAEVAHSPRTRDMSATRKGAEHRASGSAGMPTASFRIPQPLRARRRPRRDRVFVYHLDLEGRSLPI